MSDCGVFGVYGHREASNIAYLGLYMLQHRGHESAGIVSSDGKNLYRHIGMGRVLDVFKREHIEKLKGKIAIGHNRYSTTGISSLKNAQPIYAEFRLGEIAIAHNGNIVNYNSLRNELEKEGAIFHTTSDSEIILHLMAYSKEKDILSSLQFALQRIKGAYSMLVLTPKKLYAIRDPLGFRPLVLGKLGNTFLVSSETRAFDLLSAEYIREIAPGEILEISENGLESYKINETKNKAYCIFEYIYFSMPDSIVFGRSVFDVRFKFGERLANEQPADADYVIPVPDSSIVSALGYANASKIPYTYALIRSHYIGRTFIEPQQGIRDFGAKIKYNVVSSMVKGKRIVIVDDSIMRGTTAKKIVNMFKSAGAKEIHLRISAPPTRFPCYYGIDIPSMKELIASNQKEIKQIGKELGVNSIGYLSLEGMEKIIGEENKNFCKACFNGKYPIKPPKILMERPKYVNKEI
jgi:amidophosphoribosyltransferase